MLPEIIYYVPCVEPAGKKKDGSNRIGFGIMMTFAVM